MTAVVADTHAIIWYLLNPSKLSPDALAAFDQATQNQDLIFLPSISLIEIVYLVEKGRLSQEALPRLFAILEAPAAPLVLEPLNLKIIQTLRQIPFAVVPEMPDRIIAATALYLKLPLITRDPEIRAANIETIW